jgi:hypothetical protein
MSDWFDSVRDGNAFEGPYHRTEAITVTRWMRIKRWLRVLTQRWW